MAGWARKVGQTHEVNGFHHSTLGSHLMILCGVIVKHEFFVLTSPWERMEEIVGEICVSRRVAEGGSGGSNLAANPDSV